MKRSKDIVISTKREIVKNRNWKRKNDRSIQITDENGAVLDDFRQLKLFAYKLISLFPREQRGAIY
jgi:hypothetical protein